MDRKSRMQTFFFSLINNKSMASTMGRNQYIHMMAENVTIFCFFCSSLPSSPPFSFLCSFNEYVVVISVEYLPVSTMISGVQLRKFFIQSNKILTNLLFSFAKRNKFSVVCKLRENVRIRTKTSTNLKYHLIYYLQLSSNGCTIQTHKYSEDSLQYFSDKLKVLRHHN